MAKKVRTGTMQRAVRPGRRLRPVAALVLLAAGAITVTALAAMPGKAAAAGPGTTTGEQPVPVGGPVGWNDLTGVESTWYAVAGVAGIAVLMLTALLLVGTLRRRRRDRFRVEPEPEFSTSRFIAART